MNSFSIMHHVMLASILEPIPIKKGCTTRYVDYQDKSKLEYFLIAGINIGKVFYDLAERIQNNNYKQPRCIYDLAYQAQVESFKNRKGGKINFGIIELLIPIVATQVIYQCCDISVLDKVEIVLKNTSFKDVHFHHKFREVARKVSKQFPSCKYYKVNTMYDYYRIEKNDLEDNVHKEYVTGFQRIKECYFLLEQNYSEGNLLSCTLEAYNMILKKCGNYCGLAADYICIAIYLFLTKYPRAIVV